MVRLRRLADLSLRCCLDPIQGSVLIDRADISLADHLERILLCPELQEGAALSVSHQIIVGKRRIILAIADKSVQAGIDIGHLLIKATPCAFVLLGFHNEQTCQ